MKNTHTDPHQRKRNVTFIHDDVARMGGEKIAVWLGEPKTTEKRNK